MTKILVIEDTRDLREDVVEMLNLEGYETRGAENGVEGVQMVQEDCPDLIICDIMMPELNGYGVLKQVRQDPKTAMIPFIFLTAKTDRVNLRHGMVMGADDYLTKPFQIGELLDSIQTQLKRREDFNREASKRMEELRENIITALPHELRTPLNTIIGFSDMMLLEAQNLKPDQIADWATHINGAAHRLYRLVENYLYYVRLQVAKRADEAPDEFRTAVMSGVRDCIEAECMKIAQQHERQGDLTLQLEEVDRLRVAYNDMIKIVDELVDNAFKFSQPETPVTVKGCQQGGLYELNIEDRGRGMNPDQIESVGAYMQFGRQFHEQQGMGLGLAIVKPLVDLYGAQFDLSSQEDEGTRVIIRFPIAD